MASNQDNGRRADALILYVRWVAGAHIAIVPKSSGEFAVCQLLGCDDARSILNSH